MGTLKVNGMIYSDSVNEESKVGVIKYTDSLYLFNNGTDCGLYRNDAAGYVIRIQGTTRTFYGNITGDANTINGYYASAFLQLSGGTMSGALNFANGTWNLLGDDVYFGDNNIAGAFCIKGANGTTNLRMVQYGGTAAGSISFDGSNFTISNYINGTISNASKWATARTLSLTDTVTGSVSFDGSGNATMSTAIKFVSITPSTFASNFRTMIKGNASSGQFFSTIRSETGQSGQLSAYGSGIAWGTHDTHGYIYIDYSTSNVYIGGGNGNKLNWTKNLAFTDSTVAGANYASSAGNADTVDGKHFHWSGQSGQPNWLWGGNDGTNMYVYNPSNFSVSYANSAGYSTYLNTTAGNEIRFHNATGLTAGGSLWLGWAWADGNKTVTKDWYIGNFSGGGLANIYASTFNGNLNGTASSANWASGASSSNALSSTGFGDGNFTYLQTSGDFYGNSGWSHYLIANHGSGATYYNYVIALPFWNAPKYKRQTGNTSSTSGWYDFITAENYTSYCMPSSPYISINNSNPNNYPVFSVSGRIDTGCFILTNNYWTGYGTADPSSAGLTAVEGRVYFKIIG